MLLFPLRPPGIYPIPVSEDTFMYPSSTCSPSRLASTEYGRVRAPSVLARASGASSSCSSSSSHVQRESMRYPNAGTPVVSSIPSQLSGAANKEGATWNIQHATPNRGAAPYGKQTCNLQHTTPCPTPKGDAQLCMPITNPYDSDLPRCGQGACLSLRRWRRGCLP